MEHRTKQDWYNSSTWIDDERFDIHEYVGKLKASDRPPYDLDQKLEEWRERGVVIFEGVVDRALDRKSTRLNSSHSS